MTTYDEALEMLSDDEVQSTIRLVEDLAKQDAYLLENLVALRLSAGLTQADLAAAWGRHKTAVSQFEQIGNDPRLSTVRRYAASIGARYRHMVFLDEAATTCRNTMWAEQDDVDETGSELLNVGLKYA